MVGSSLWLGHGSEEIEQRVRDSRVYEQGEWKGGICLMVGKGKNGTL